jgi:hypothetical protein
MPQLYEKMLQVTMKTMQPASISLWLSGDATPDDQDSSALPGG